MAAESAVGIDSILELCDVPCRTGGCCNGIVVDDYHYKGLEVCGAVGVDSAVDAVVDISVERCGLSHLNVLLHFAPGAPGAALSGACIYIAVATAYVEQGKYLGDAVVGCKDSQAGTE